MDVEKNQVFGLISQHDASDYGVLDIEYVREGYGEGSSDLWFCSSLPDRW